MGLETNTDVEQVSNVQNAAGEPVPPASGDYAHGSGVDVTITDGALELDIDCPDRPVQVVLHADGFDAAASISLETVGDVGNTVTKRDKADNSAYATGDGSTDILVKAAVAAPQLRIRIRDDSPTGTENSCNYSVMVA
ncbi:hypothetical protein BRC71_06340 [Halobacteriales archaeon QH_7_65_31]|nr:MAG: hypothetical protein BRC71_06340 [Halobacteriales archaeon QH_7_65_31]